MLTLVIFDDEPQSIIDLRALIDTHMPKETPYRILEAHDLTVLKGILAATPQIDILLADIVMPEGQPSGIEVVRELFGPESGTQVIYVSGYLDMAPKVYGTSHIYFLLKPIDEDRLEEALAMACSALSKRKQPMLQIKTGYKNRLINVSTITYLESSVHKVTVHCRTDAYDTYVKLDDILDRLPSSFCRCHRSFAVNLAYVSSLDEDELLLYDGTRIPVSRRRAKAVQRALLDYVSSRAKDQPWS